jgi:hypothetical protein
MAKKKKPRGKQKSRAELDAAFERLGVIEKDVAKVRANLRKYVIKAEKVMSGIGYHLPLTRTSRPKTPRK